MGKLIVKDHHAVPFSNVLNKHGIETSIYYDKNVDECNVPTNNFIGNQKFAGIDAAAPLYEIYRVLSSEGLLQ